MGFRSALLIYSRFSFVVLESFYSLFAWCKVCLSQQPVGLPIPPDHKVLYRGLEICITQSKNNYCGPSVFQDRNCE